MTWRRSFALPLASPCNPSPAVMHLGLSELRLRADAAAWKMEEVDEAKEEEEEEEEEEV